jgi:carbon-monoxide dehydrogenase medium subunit
MFPAKFEYVAASSVEEAIGLLQRENGEGKILAGGHSLLPLMKLRLAQPRLLIDIGRVPGLASIRPEDGYLSIGAMATYRDLIHSEEVRRRIPVLAEAASKVGDPQVRARGTLVGSLAHADPAGDMPAVILALDGTIKAVGPNGAREIKADDFFVDLLTTALQENEIATAVRVPTMAPRSGAAYVKFDQPASHYALTGVCAVVSLGDGGTIRGARIGITGVGPKAYRPTAVERALLGKQPSEQVVSEASKTAADGVDVQGDIHASPEYRAHLARVLTRRAVMQAAERARGH